MRLRNLVWVVVLGIVFAFGTAMAHADPVVWDANTGFISGTTQGQTQTGTELWQYFRTDEGVDLEYNLMTWDTNDGGNWGASPLVGHLGGSNLYIYPSNGDPGTAVVGWRSPVSGLVDVSFSFGGDPLGSGNGITYHLFKDIGTSELASGIVADGETYSTTLHNVAVSVGTMLYLQEGPNGIGNASGDDFSASFTITQVPEPGTTVLLCTGLIGLLAYAWRKQK